MRYDKPWDWKQFLRLSSQADKKLKIFSTEKFIEEKRLENFDLSDPEGKKN